MNRYLTDAGESIPESDLEVQTMKPRSFGERERFIKELKARIDRDFDRVKEPIVLLTKKNQETIKQLDRKD